MSGRRDSYHSSGRSSHDRHRASQDSHGYDRRSSGSGKDYSKDRSGNSSFRKPDNYRRNYDNKSNYDRNNMNTNKRFQSRGNYKNNYGGGNYRDNNRQDNRQRMNQRRDNRFDNRRNDYQNQGRRGGGGGGMRDRYGSQGSLNRRNDNRRLDNNDRRRMDNNRRPYNNRRFGQPMRRNFSNRFQQQDRRTRLQRLARLPGRDNDREGGGKIDDKTTALRRKLAEKHLNKRPRQDLLAKKIRMAKMRSTLGARRAAYLKSKTVASKVVKKSDKKKDKDEEEELDDQEKEIHEEEKAAKEDDGGVKVKDESLIEKKKEEKKDEKKSKISINLTCIHCNSKCLTVKEYILHLGGRAHERAMSRLALRQKAQLSRLRLAQRNTQKEIDEKLTEKRSQHCNICQLNFKQSRADHEETEDHCSIKKFCIPYCNICKVGFQRPMLYESHRCSIQHLRRKAIMEKTGKVSSDDERELDLSKYSTIDEIAGDAATGSEESQGEEKEEPEEEEAMDTGEDINVGNEHVIAVETKYCELCFTYISHRGDPAVNLKRHCALRSHLKYYIRYKDDLMLKEEAEAMHKRREAEKKKKATEKSKKAEKEKEKEKLNGSKDAEADESDTEDKAEDEETATERFDRFKTNGGEEEKSAENGSEKTVKKTSDSDAKQVAVEA